jgi:hypothetical protein
MELIRTMQSRAAAQLTLDNALFSQMRGNYWKGKSNGMGICYV